MNALLCEREPFRAGVHALRRFKELVEVGEHVCEPLRCPLSWVSFPSPCRPLFSRLVLGWVLLLRFQHLQVLRNPLQELPGVVLTHTQVRPGALSGAASGIWASFQLR